jgi:hypothetical protein
MRRELDSILDAARTLERDALPALIGELATIHAIAFARLVSPVIESRDDVYLNITQAAQYLCVEKSFLYQRSHQLGKRVGRRLVFSRKALDRFVERSKPKSLRPGLSPD